jgi:plasmid stabilization system protein ParE
MPTKIRWTEAAYRDLQETYAYMAEDDPETAADVITGIQDAANLLSTSPGLGRPGRVPNTRELILPRLSFLIAYRLVQRDVEILGVLHMKRSPEE